jgi:hypothetical protein
VITLVSVDRIDQVWPHVRQALEGACRRTGGDLTSLDLWRQCRSGEAFLAVVHDDLIRAATVARLEQWTSGRKLRVLALAGMGRKEWLGDLFDYGCNFARDNGATSIIFDGRKGWERALAGARVRRVVYEVPA